MITRSGARRWTAGVALAAAAGMAATACGGGSSKGGAGGVWKGDPVAALTAADGPAAKAKTVHIEGDTTDDQGSRKLSGGIDFSTTVRADLTMTVSDSIVFKKPTQLRMLVDGPARYVNTDAFRDLDPSKVKDLDGKHWVTQKPGSARQQTSGSTFGAALLESDPDLIRALGVVFASGALNADGTGHYTGTVAADALATMKFDDAHREAIAGAMKAGYISSEKVDVWFGADGLPTEIKYADTMVSNRAPSEGDIHFTDWGKPVRMTIPDASDVKVVETID